MSDQILDPSGAGTPGRRVDFDHGAVRLAVREHAARQAAPQPPAVLISGWPQSALVWRKVIPTLTAAGRAVFAVESRGFGDSSAPASGYDLDTVASEIAALLRSLAPDGVVELVGHDVGSWVCHAVAALFPEAIRSVALVDAAIPGLTAEPVGYPDDLGNIRSWHFGLNRLPELPEILLDGHEREFLEWYFRHKSVIPGAIEPGVVEEYTRLLRDPARRHAGFEYYREAFGDRGRERSRERGRLPLRVPVLTVGARSGVGDLLETTLRPLAEHLEAVILDCGHYVPEERPLELAEALLRFWSRKPSPV